VGPAGKAGDVADFHSISALVSPRISNISTIKQATRRVIDPARRPVT